MKTKIDWIVFFFNMDGLVVKNGPTFLKTFALFIDIWNENLKCIRGSPIFENYYYTSILELLLVRKNALKETLKKYLLSNRGNKISIPTVFLISLCAMWFLH